MLSALAMRIEQSLPFPDLVNLFVASEIFFHICRTRRVVYVVPVRLEVLLLLLLLLLAPAALPLLAYTVAPLVLFRGRPVGERALCRSRLWRGWDGGFWRGGRCGSWSLWYRLGESCLWFLQFWLWSADWLEAERGVNWLFRWSCAWGIGVVLVVEDRR